MALDYSSRKLFNYEMFKLIVIKVLLIYKYLNRINSINAILEFTVFFT